MKNFFRKILIFALFFGILSPALSSGQISFAQTIDNNTTFGIPPDNSSLLTPPQTPTNQPTGNKAQDLQNTLKSEGDISCGFWPGSKSPFSGECIAKGMAWVLSLFVDLAGFFLTIAGFVFNASLGVTIDNENYTYEKVSALKAGWEFSRDIVNIFFIFILLFIAIAIILQLEQYGEKKLLVRLIIIALLVNLSFLVAQSVIFISNALTVQIYQNIGAKKSTLESFYGLKYSQDISAAITSGFQPQKILQDVPLDKLPNLDTLKVLIGIIEIETAAVIIILIAAIILFITAFFLITRMAVLWLILILAPFGFVFLILPTTKSYAQRWWQTLFSQSIFAPVFLFLLLITLIIIRDFGQFLNKAGQINSIGEFMFLIFMQAALTVILMIASLMAAKQMGIYGSAGALGWANSVGKNMQTSFSNWAKRGSHRIAKIADTVATLPGRTPLVGGALRVATKPLTAFTGGALRTTEKAVLEREKQYKDLSPRSLASIYRGTVTPSERQNIMRIASETGKLEKFSEKELAVAYDQNKNNPKALNNILKVRPDLIEKDPQYKDKDPKIEKAQQVKAITQVVANMSEKDIEEKLDKIAVTSSKILQETMVRAMGEKEMVASLRKFGSTTIDAIKNGRANMGSPADQFRELLNDNRSLLRGLFRNPALSVQLRDFRNSMAIEAERYYGTMTPARDWQRELNV
ncbi:hypothetical protein HYW53_01250 [Candidatus Giovannonibacteria bacterium]|nr:hypothetical protein [Candidatus Giovannonibacteria bacterium]